MRVAVLCSETRRSTTARAATEDNEGDDTSFDIRRSCDMRCEPSDENPRILLSHISRAHWISSAGTPYLSQAVVQATDDAATAKVTSISVARRTLFSRQRAAAANCDYAEIPVAALLLMHPFGSHLLRSAIW